MTGPSPYKSILLSVALVLPVLYLCTSLRQSDGYSIIVAYSVAFLAYGALIYNKNYSKNSLYLLVGVGILVRAILVFLFPNLSDDIYRFMWDGNMIQDGINPLTCTPREFLSIYPRDSRYEELFPLLNSQDYYTVYPPVSQVIYWFSSLFPTWNLSSIAMKAVLFFSEIGSALLIMRLLDRIGQSRSYVLWYFLNPLVIVEMVGQLHFEAVMIFFLLAGLVLLSQKRLFLAGSMMALSVGAKLLPLMFLPLMIKYLGSVKKFGRFVLGGLVTLLVTFLPMFFRMDISHFLSSVNLYFQSFEFNAGIYYLLRKLGWLLTDYNQIKILGPLLSLVTVGVILYTATKVVKGNLASLLKVFFISFATYLFLATTVHPWYLCMLVMLALFQRSWWPLVWSGVVVWSYTTYMTPEFVQNLGLISVEYLVVYGCLIYEYFRKQSTKVG